MKNIKFQRRHSRNCFVWGPVVETDAVCVLVVIYGQRGRKRCSHRNGAAHETNDTQQFQLCRPLTERRWTGKKFDIYTPAFDLWHHFAQRVGSLVFIDLFLPGNLMFSCHLNENIRNDISASKDFVFKEIRADGSWNPMNERGMWRGRPSHWSWSSTWLGFVKVSDWLGTKWRRPLTGMQLEL